MAGHRVFIVPLLIALAVAAYFAPGASAEGTTAFTCEPVLKEIPSGFSDAHCDDPASAPAVRFKHEVIPAGAPGLEVSVSNSKTEEETKLDAPVFITWTPSGIAVGIECIHFNTTAAGNLQNTLVGGVMQAKITAITFQLTGCTVEKPTGGACKVAEPISATVNGTTFESEKESGVEITSTKTNFTEITLESVGEKKCAVKGTFAVTGSLIGHPRVKNSGSTLSITKEFGSLKIGSTSVKLETTLTFHGPGVSGWAISLTTTNP